MPRPRPAGSFALRPLLALGAVAGLHVALAGLMLGTAVWRGWQLTKTVEIELVSTQVKEVQQLPFGPPPPPPGRGGARGAAPAEAAAAADQGVRWPPTAGPPTPGRPMAAAAMPARTPGDARGDGGADGRGPRPRDLRQYGPEGSRLTAILRLDRLRASPDAPQTIAAVDRLLMNLPDRRRLLEGTDLDLYRDFDVILIATPNPHGRRGHLPGRAPPPERRAADGRAEQGRRGRGPARSPGAPRAGDRWGCGGRARRARRGATRRGRRGWSATTASWCCRSPGWPSWPRPPTPALLIPGKAGAKRADGMPARRRQRRHRRTSAGASWSPASTPRAGRMPDDAILMMTAANLTGRRARAAPIADAPELTAPGGLRLPEFATVVVGTTPAPFLQADGEFSRVADARAWQEQWPKLRQQLLASPFLLLSGFSGIVSGAEVNRRGAHAHRAHHRQPRSAKADPDVHREPAARRAQALNHADCGAVRRGIWRQFLVFCFPE